MSEEVAKNEVTESADSETPEPTAEVLSAPDAAAEETTADEPVAEAETVTSEDEVSSESEEDEAPADEQPAAEAETASDSGLSINDLKVGMELKGTVKSIELYGAFVDIGVGKDALLHISQLGKPNVRNVEDIVKKGDEITVFVLKVEPNSERIALSLEKPPSNPMSQLKVGDLVTGQVSRIENFGVFLDIGAERAGMIHVSELATGYVKSPEDVVSMGDEIQARVIKVNRKKRQIDLSIKAIEEDRVQAETAAAVAADDDEPVPTAMEIALRRAMSESQDSVTNRGDNNKKQRNSTKKRKALDDVLSRTLKQHND